MLEPISFRREAPYNDLPLLPPAQDVETKRTLKQAIRARTALSDLKGAGRLIPNQAMLVRSIVLQEAKLSSEIENIVTTNDELYRALSIDGVDGNPHTKEVLRYGDALWHGYSWLQRGGLLTPNLFAEIASIIKEHQMDVRKLGGTRIANPLTREVIYSPPEGEARLRRLLDNLSHFLYTDDDIEPLIKLAIAHYQFEATHPFSDGNGRTGRVINILYLVEQKLVDLPVLYLSGYIIKNKGDYYRGLRRVTEDAAWEDWVVYMLDAVEQTAIETRKRIEGIYAAMEESAEIVKAQAPKIYSRELIETIYSQPYTRIAFLEQAKIAKRQTASEYLKRLEALGLLVSVKRWRDNFYLNPRLMEILAA